tara:strand:+ start:59 stop:250 length:192 start_codon:yes stop_codon:yes gene_type:complete
MNPTCDNACTLMGWIEYSAEVGAYDLHISVAPDTDLDDKFHAFCHDEQEMIWVNGWNAILETI